MTCRSITTSTTTTLRHLALGLLLVLCLAPPGGAGDPDDDWGLPSMSSSSSNQSSGGEGNGGSSKAASSTLGAGSGSEAPALDDVLAAEAGRAQLAAEGLPWTPQELAGGVTAILPADAPELAATDGGLGVQGAALITPPAGAELRLLAPADAAHQAAFLVLDDGVSGTLAELLVSPEGRAHVLGVAALGPLHELDVLQLRQKVEAYAPALAGLRVSVAVLSVDGAGAPHMAAVRVAPGEAAVELLTL